MPTLPEQLVVYRDRLTHNSSYFTSKSSFVTDIMLNVGKRETSKRSPGPNRSWALRTSNEGDTSKI